MSLWLSVCLVVWFGPFLVLFFWDGYLSLQMFNYRIIKKDGLVPRGRKFAFQTDPADYSEIGQSYRSKSIQLEIAMLIWVLASVVILIILGVIFHK
jgi:hypothetical protein